MNTEVDYIHYVVIGIGINVNQTEFPEELRETASSLRLETGRSYSRAELAACIMDELEPVYETFLKTEDLRDCIRNIMNCASTAAVRYGCCTRRARIPGRPEGSTRTESCWCAVKTAP